MVGDNPFFFSSYILRRERLDQITPGNEIENEVEKERRSKRILVAGSKNAMLMFMLRALPLVVGPPPKTN